MANQAYSVLRILAGLIGTAKDLRTDGTQGKDKHRHDKKIPPESDAVREITEPLVGTVPRQGYGKGGRHERI